MAWGPRLNTVCGRCGKPRGLTHTCFGKGKRKPSLKPKVTWGKCPDCGKSYGANPLVHVCRKPSDFKRRKAEHERWERQRAREKARKERPRHDYTECSDRECKRSLCVAYKSGIEEGEQRGYGRGWNSGYERGKIEGREQS